MPLFCPLCSSWRLPRSAPQMHMAGEITDLVMQWTKGSSHHSGPPNQVVFATPIPLFTLTHWIILDLDPNASSLLPAHHGSSSTCRSSLLQIASTFRGLERKRILMQLPRDYEGQHESVEQFTNGSGIHPRAGGNLLGGVEYAERIVLVCDSTTCLDDIGS